MDAPSQIELRTKKLGVLMRDARLAARRSPADCAEAMGISRRVLKAYEEGRRAPSLPELETLAYFLKLPIDHFWARSAVSGQPAESESLDLPKLVQLRQRMIGALLRQERVNANLSIKTVAQETGIPARRIKNYELGQRAIPLPELEAMVVAVSGRVETFFDQGGPIGQWMAEQKAMKEFLDLPAELQAFVSKPVNRPYLELAVKLSSMSSEKMRSVAEGLLDITL